MVMSGGTAMSTISAHVPAVVSVELQNMPGGQLLRNVAREQRLTHRCDSGSQMRPESCAPQSLSALQPQKTVLLLAVSHWWPLVSLAQASELDPKSPNTTVH